MDHRAPSPTTTAPATEPTTIPVISPLDRSSDLSHITQTMGLRKNVPLSAYIEQNIIFAATRGEHGTWDGFTAKVDALCARFGKALPRDC